MVEGYFNDNNRLKLVVFLLDSRHLPTDDDLDFYNFLNEYDYKYVLCMTKCDKLNMSMKAKIKKNVSEKFGADALTKDLISVSINDKNSIGKLKEYILNVVEG